MARYIQAGRIINYRNDTNAAIKYGDVIVITGHIGIATVDITAGSIGSAELEGVYELPAENTVAYTVGQGVYWDATNGRVTSTKAASGAIVAGMVIEPKDVASATALVKLGVVV